MFSPNTTTYRGECPTRQAIYRDEHPARSPISITPVGIEPKLDFAGDVAKADNRPPQMPYRAEFRAPNTFVSHGNPAADVRSVVEAALQGRADITRASDWVLQGVFHPRSRRTEFFVNMFADTGPKSGKDSLLVEMQLVAGDRIAFESLCSHVCRQTGFVFADLPDEFEVCWFPESTTPATADTDVGAACNRSAFPRPPPLVGSEMAYTVGPLLDILATNALAKFADVRRDAWQELAQVTTDASLAAGLLCIRIGGLDTFTAIRNTLSSCRCMSDDISRDTQRCALQTLLQVSKAANNQQMREVAAMKESILGLVAEELLPLETRSLAVALIELLLEKADFAETEQSPFVHTLTSCMDGSRVAAQAQAALQSLKAC